MEALNEEEQELDMHRLKPPTAYASFVSRAAAPDISRKQFLRGVAGVGAGIAVSSLLTACGDRGSETPDAKIRSIADLGKVGGDLGVATFDGLQGGDAIKPWLAKNKVTLQFQAINSQQEVTAKLKGAGAKTLDVVEYSPLEGNSYVDLKIPCFLELDWFPNGHLIRSEFTDLFRQPDGSVSAIPFMFGASPCNYRPDRVETIQSWHDLLDSKFKNRITLIDDALSNVSTAALALGHEDTSKLTPAQLKEVGDFLRGLVGQARTIAPSYGDMLQLLTSGEVYATFSGWSAMDVFAAQQNAVVRSAYPKEKVMGTVDAHLIPTTASNPGTAAAFINQFIEPEMQRYVATALGGGSVRTDSAEVLKGEEGLVFDPNNLDQLFKEKLLFIEAAPLQAKDGYVDRQAWLDLWERVKA
ncbi:MULTISPECIES: ABC transporter substrate-binding protein [unclassified Pseudarthrobacter]|uniref:ABC transporter substrate-binding protein n=1 Tax=unclassified Pseudarthrobacter TaxID=2647000 RepID=UPI0030777EDB